MGVLFKVIDKGYDNFLSEIRILKTKPKVKVGILEENNLRSDGKKNSELMMKHEFGIGVPQRSIIRAGTDDNVDKVFSLIIKEYEEILRNKSNFDKMFNKVGAFMKEKFKERFSKEFLLPNSPVTIKRKGSDIPLVDEGELKKSMDYKIE